MLIDNVNIMSIVNTFDSNEIKRIYGVIIQNYIRFPD